MRIPEVRARLHQIADLLRHGDEWAGTVDLDSIADDLDTLADQTWRRRNGPKAPADPSPMNDDVAYAIRAYRQAYPEATMVRIGQVFGVNQGRVSEALHGKRK